ncbi:hypothetical protein J6590_062057 [Homalodisca vitripennis]|nr:hypothetical protein J6590_062057 [Homalodisca vitripennis]
MGSSFFNRKAYIVFVRFYWRSSFDDVDFWAGLASVSQASEAAREAAGSVGDNLDAAGVGENGPLVHRMANRQIVTIRDRCQDDNGRTQLSGDTFLQAIVNVVGLHRSDVVDSGEQDETASRRRGAAGRYFQELAPGLHMPVTLVADERRRYTMPARKRA